MKMDWTWCLRHGRVVAIGAFVFVEVALGWLGFGASVFAQHRMHGQQEKVDRNHPWFNASLSPDERAEMVLKEMTLDEKIGLLHGHGHARWLGTCQNPEPELGNGGAGFVLGVPTAGDSDHPDERCGVRSAKSGENGRYSTALPANRRRGRELGYGSGLRIMGR